MSATLLWNGVTTVVCDLDGVVYLGEEGIGGAGDALRRFESAGLQLLFVTNNSSKSPRDVVDKIARTVGFAANPEAVLTSAIVTADRLVGQADRVLVVGASSIETAITERGMTVVTDWREADAVVVGLDTHLSYGKLSTATLAIRNGAAFYATNSDATYPTPDGLLPGGGAIVAALETATDRQAIVSGKPHRPMIEAIASRATGDVVVVGDRIDTDVAMARTAGWRSILVLTGVVSPDERIPVAGAPDLVVESLAAAADSYSA